LSFPFKFRYTITSRANQCTFTLGKMVKEFYQWSLRPARSAASSPDAIKVQLPFPSKKETGLLPGQGGASPRTTIADLYSQVAAVAAPSQTGLLSGMPGFSQVKICGTGVKSPPAGTRPGVAGFSTGRQAQNKLFFLLRAFLSHS
jgi:hypothetical protein